MRPMTNIKTRKCSRFLQTLSRGGFQGIFTMRIKTAIVGCVSIYPCDDIGRDALYGNCARKLQIIGQ